MDSKIVQNSRAVCNGSKGDAIRPAYADGWSDIEARRSLGHIVGYVDLDVADLVDIVIDTINKEL